MSLGGGQRFLGNNQITSSTSGPIAATRIPAISQRVVMFFGSDGTGG